MNELENARMLIDEADEQIAELFEKRMNAVKEIAEYKAKHGLPIFDAEREKAVIEKNTLRLSDNTLKPYYSELLSSFMNISKRYQQDILYGIKTAYCGTDGAFAHIALKRIFPYALSVACPDFRSAYDSVLKGECSCCVLPVENSYAGEVGQVIDLMFDGELFVNGVYDMPVKQNLVGIKGTDKSRIKKVISHPQALLQCAEYIGKSGFETQQSVSTASAARTVAELGDASVAAIASEETAGIYGLDIIDCEINESAVNTTRFAVFSKSPGEIKSDSGKFILLFTVNDRVGALAKAVNIICAHGFNMSVLRSRPVKNVPWQYYFYVEADGNGNSEESMKMLNELSVCCERLKIAGHYSSNKNI